MIFQFLVFWIFFNVILLQNLTCQTVFQQRFFEEITDNNGEVCPNDILRQHEVASVIRCGMGLLTEQRPLVFTFDQKKHICRIYREEDFSGCVFQICSSCKSYRAHQSEGNVTVNDTDGTCKIDSLDNYIFTFRIYTSFCCLNYRYYVVHMYTSQESGFMLVPHKVMETRVFCYS
jgi:hypothetical protein